MSGSGSYCSGGGGGSTKVIGLITDDAVVVPADPATGDIYIHGGTNVTTSGNAGTYTVTINAAGSGSFVWVLADSTPLTLTAQTGYSVQNASQVIFTLPTTCAFGEVIRIAGLSGSGWLININAGQTVIMGTDAISTSISSDETGSCVELLCAVADTVFEVISSMGNITEV